MHLRVYAWREGWEDSVTIGDLILSAHPVWHSLFSLSSTPTSTPPSFTAFLVMWHKMVSGPEQTNIMKEPWFIGMLISTIGGTLWLALCIFSIWLCRKRKNKKKMAQNGMYSGKLMFLLLLFLLKQNSGKKTSSMTPLHIWRVFIPYFCKQFFCCWHCFILFTFNCSGTSA